MLNWSALSDADKKKLLQRPVFNNEGLGKAVSGILQRVRQGGDGALARLTLELDGCTPDAFELGREQLQAAVNRTDPALIEAINDASNRIRGFHAADIPRDTSVGNGAGSDL